MKTLTWPVSAPQAHVDTFAARKRGVQEREVCHLITPRMKFCAKPRPEVACQGDAGGKGQPPQDSAGGGVRTQVWAEMECSEIDQALTHIRGLREARIFGSPQLSLESLHSKQIFHCGVQLFRGS